MKKRQKKSKKEDHKLLKFFFLALFFILLGITIAKYSAEEPKIASYYAPQKTLQIGWFTIFKKFINPGPNDSIPTPTPTPCPGGVHDTGNINKASQSIAFVPPPANPPAERPVIIINPTTPTPAPIHNPCYPPFP